MTSGFCNFFAIDPDRPLTGLFSAIITVVVVIVVVIIPLPNGGMMI
jgi:hypothetical protein